ncbi:MAG: hypothetical protein QOJ93_1432 [Actinomycetota bacterium]|nr:hypothetical protein [Actinomycetota bacterium]
MRSAGGVGHAAPPGGGRRKRTPSLRILGLIASVSLVAAIVAISAVSRHTAATGPSPALRATADVSSNHSSFTYVPGGQGVAVSSRQYHKGAPGILTLDVYGMPPAVGDTSATIYADLSNGTGQTALFVDGPLVAVTVTHDGKPYRQLTLSQPAVLSLDPAHLLKLQASVPLDGAGTYELSADLVGVGKNPAFTLRN